MPKGDKAWLRFRNLTGRTFDRWTMIAAAITLFEVCRVAGGFLASANHVDSTQRKRERIYATPTGQRAVSVKEGRTERKK